MIIKSLKLRNFKKHQSLDLSFDANLNLIGGPNEVGKSTIAEAIHAALFFRHSGKPQEILKLQSILSQEGPSVEVEFDQEGRVYILKKVFLRGASCTLTSAGQPTLTGTAAEESLGTLLSSQANLGSPALAKTEWAHLWVWQGTAGNNPVGELDKQKGKLFAQLDKLGVMAAISSEKDHHVASVFSEKMEEIFVRSGNSYKASSKQAQVEKALQDSQLTLSNLTESIKSIESKSVDFSNKEAKLKSLKEELESLKEDAEAIQTELKVFFELKSHTFEEENKLTNLLKKEEELREKSARINSLEEKILKKQNELKPFDVEVRELMNRLQASNDRLSIEKTNQKKLSNELDLLRQESDFCQLLDSISEKNKELLRIDNLLKNSNEIQTRIDSFKMELRGLPLVEQKDLDKWSALESSIEKAKGILEAIATELEILEDQPQVSSGDILLKGKLLLTEETILQLNGIDFLKITPGGGKNLALAQEQYQNALQALIEFKKELGVEEKQRVRDILVQRARLEVKIAQESTKLETFEPLGNLEEKKNGLEDSLTHLSLKKDTSLKLIPSLVKLLEKDLDEYRKLVQDKLGEVSFELDKCFSRIEILEKKLGSLSGEKEEKLTLSRVLLDSLSGLTSNFTLLKEQLEEDPDSLEILKSKRMKQEYITLDLKERLKALTGDQLEAKDKRIQEALKSKVQQEEELKLTVADLRGQLKTDGHQNLYQDQQSAFVRSELLQGQFEGLKREGDAIKLLNQLFSQEQQEMTRNYATPFAEKVQFYLSFIFGKNISVEILSDAVGGFEGLRVYRDKFKDLGTLEFDKLSGGTREQMAAAVRLAMAEVLAPAYGGHLPMVFDDAFAYSDKDRLKVLPDMLFAASQRGIQIIILSCTPQDYAGLGGHQTDLSA